MYDISLLSNDEILDYQYNYLIHHCIRDLEEMVEVFETKDKGLLAAELHMLLLKYNPSY